ncbi:MAG: hypothetical protein H0U13_00500, partial [Gemmatimonadaceae bacterium]|nr:hypothetical protein [Gemmatimonadaceae bacterium]
MEGQGKRLLLAVGLALGVMLLWNMVFPSEPPPEPPPGVGSGSGQTPATAVATAKSKVCHAKPPADGKPVDMKPAESPVELVTRTFPGKLNAKFSAENAALVSWQLADARFQKDYTQGEL